MFEGGWFRFIRGGAPGLEDEFMSGRVEGKRLGAEVGRRVRFLGNPFWGEFFGKSGDNFFWGLLGGDRGGWIGRGSRGMR